MFNVGFVGRVGGAWWPALAWLRFLRTTPCELRNSNKSLEIDLATLRIMARRPTGPNPMSVSYPVRLYS